MGCFRVVVFHGSYKSLLGLSQMALINVLVNLILKILQNLVFVQNFCSQVTARVSKSSKSVQRDITFILNLLSDTVNVFV